MKKFEQISYEESKSFGRNQNNRNINKQHLARIQKQCETSFDLMPPITVNKVTNHVIDGQHRLQAYQNLIEKEKLNETKRIWVMWVKVPIEVETQAIIDANTHSKSWSVDDFIESYVKDGVEEYDKLNKWCRSHQLTYQHRKPKYRYATAILTGKNCSSVLKKGEFAMTDEDIKKGNLVYNEIADIVDLYNLTSGPWLEAFAIVWNKMRGLHNFAEWIKFLNKDEYKDNKAYPKTKQKDWITLLSMVNTEINMSKPV